MVIRPVADVLRDPLTTAAVPGDDADPNQVAAVSVRNMSALCTK